jgi:hypothetical protein
MSFDRFDRRLADPAVTRFDDAERSEQHQSSGDRIEERA